MRARSFYRIVFLACALCIGYTPAASPQAPPSLGQKSMGSHVGDPIRALDFLIGKWQGTVKYEPGANPLSEAFWSANVHHSPGGNILLIEERGGHIENRDSTTVEIVVVVYWDPAVKEYPARLYWSSKDGAGSAEGKAYVENRTFVLSTGGNRYTVMVDDQGRWQEVGESSRDGGASWSRLFHMTMDRQE